jgi:hypothetical protein
MELIEKISNYEQYFEQNSKFFNAGDVNAKRAFFYIGNYTRKVMECQEKVVAEQGGEDAFHAKITRLATSNMNYRVFTLIAKLLDDTALKCNSKLFFACSGQCKQYMIQSDLPTNKRAISPEDANIAYSLGLYQKM